MLHSLLNPSQKYELSKKGAELQHKIIDLLKQAEDNLEDWLNNKPRKAKAFLTFIGSFIFIIEKYDLDKIKELHLRLKDVEFDEKLRASYAASYDFIYQEANLDCSPDTQYFDSVAFDFNSLDSFDFSNLDFSASDSGGGDGAG